MSIAEMYVILSAVILALSIGAVFWKISRALKYSLALAHYSAKRREIRERHGIKR